MSGVHYPVGGDGHADLERGGLRVAEEGGWRFAADEEPQHNDVNHSQELELDVGGES